MAKWRNHCGTSCAIGFHSSRPSTLDGAKLYQTLRRWEGGLHSFCCYTAPHHHQSLNGQPEGGLESARVV